MPPPLISVVIPVFNRETIIARAIQSVLDQSYRNFEIIVVDDGSKDGTHAVVQGLKRKSDQISYYYQENSGPAAARNKGIEAARGEFIAFLDSDDCWHPTKLEKQILFLKAHPDLGFAHCWIEVMNPLGKRVLRHPTYAGFVFDHLLTEGNFIATSATIVKKSIFDQVGSFDEQLKGPEDFDLWLRMARQYKLGYVGQYLVLKNEQAPNCLQNNHVQMFENLQQVMAKHLNSVENSQKKCHCLARYYRKSVANFYDVPKISTYILKMIQTYPKILLELRTYRIMMGFIKNKFLRHIPVQSRNVPRSPGMKNREVDDSIMVD